MNDTEYKDLVARMHERYGDDFPEHVTIMLADLDPAPPRAYDPALDQPSLDEHAEYHGEIGHRSTNGRDVDWDALLMDYETARSVDLGTENDSPAIRRYKRRYRLAWKEANE